MRQWRSEHRLMRYSTHERLKNETLSRQRKVWEAKRQSDEKSRRELRDALRSMIRHELDYERNGSTSTWRVVHTIKEGLFDQTFMWGNDDHLLRHIADEMAYMLYRDLRERNHLRMTPGTRYEIGRFSQYDPRVYDSLLGLGER